MLYFQNFNSKFVAKGFTVGTNDLTQVRNNLFRIKTFQYSTVIDIQDQIDAYDHEGEYIGTFLVRDLENPVYNSIINLWQATDVILERVT